MSNPMQYLHRLMLHYIYIYKGHMQHYLRTRRQNVPLFFCSLSCWLQLLSVRLQLLLLLQDRFPSKALEGEPAPSSWGISWISPPKLSTSTVLLSDSLRPPACSSIRAPVGEETAGGLAGVTAGGDGARTSAGPSPTAGDSGVVGGVLRTELVPLLGCSCSLSSAISSSRAGSTQGSSGAVTAGGGELAASVSESENSSFRVFLGHWTWILDHTSFWPLVRQPGDLSSIPVDILALFSGISQNPERPLLFFSFTPLYFFEGEPLVLGFPLGSSLICGSVGGSASSSELLHDGAPRSSTGPLSSNFLGELLGSQSPLLLLLVLPFTGLFNARSPWPCAFFLLPPEPSSSTSNWPFLLAVSGPSWTLGSSSATAGALKASDGLPLSQCCGVRGRSGRPAFRRLARAPGWSSSSWSASPSSSRSLSSVELPEPVGSRGMH